MLLLLTTVLLTALRGWQPVAVTGVPDVVQRAESSVMTPQRQHHHEATLTDATQLYRVCSSRPQRMAPTQGARSVRTLTPSCGFARQHIVKPLRSFFDSRCRLESAPFCLSASCHYYVIALRHIIR